MNEPVEVATKKPSASEPNGDCKHGNCCQQFGYTLSFVQYLLDTLPNSPERDIAARVMDEAGK